MPEKLTLESRIASIREASDLTELKRLVGPSAEERAAAEQRLRQLDALSPACEWNSVCPSWAAREARERWNRVMAEQGAFENAYC